jgi:metal-responsive CopG/Arc/MetJ family transcriptional regulator
MAVLTVSDDLLVEVDQSAQLEKISREEFVQKAIRIYLRLKRWEQIRGWGRALAEGGVTEEDIALAIREKA